MTTIPASPPARFTGWHMAAILGAFFGVVIVVNVVMARLASSTFSGEVVANSYVASQDFTRWLAEARAAAALGWRAQPVLAGGNLQVDLTDASGRALTGAA
jgi:nitrogen fixation protein FixH